MRPCALLQSVSIIAKSASFCRLLVLSLAAMAPLGCEESRPRIPIQRVDTSTPEGQFEWAMQRLERAVLEFQPSSQAGLRIGKRKVSYEIFPPGEKAAHFTAQVIVESEAVYVHDQPLQSVEKEQREERRRQRARDNFEQQVKSDDPLAESKFDPVQEKFLSQMEDMAAKSGPPRAPAPVIETPEMNDRKVYELAYLEDRWQLQTEPETEHERLWFEYALQQ